MNASNALSAGSPPVPVPLSWTEFLFIGLVVLTVSVPAIIAPLLRRRMLLPTDVLQEPPRNPDIS
jgi:hypothetical protein